MATGAASDWGKAMPKKGVTPPPTKPTMPKGEMDKRFEMGRQALQAKPSPQPIGLAIGKPTMPPPARSDVMPTKSAVVPVSKGTGTLAKKPAAPPARPNPRANPSARSRAVTGR
jgi:hypothetical protein